MRSRNDTALALLRIGVGVLFLDVAQYKVFGSAFTLGGTFQRAIEGFVHDGVAYPFFVPVLRGFVLPHATAIAFFVAYGELAIGIALVLGVLTRVASAFGLVYMLTLFVCSNYPGAHAAWWHYLGGGLEHLPFAFCFAAFLVGDAERVLALRVPWRRRVGSGG